MSRRVTPQPLTAEAFAPYGDVIEVSDAAHHYPINHGYTTRYHDLAKLQLSDEGGKAGVSIFRSTPLEMPVEVKLMEYHPKSSQAFMPLSGRPYLVVVAKKGELNPDAIAVFKAAPTQGVNYHAGTWHHFCLALEGESDFLVIDRICEDDNCVEVELDAADRVLVDA